MERSAEEWSVAARSEDGNSEWRARGLRTGLILAAVGGLLLIPVPVHVPALWFGAATDFLHVPIFATLTYALAKYCFPRLPVVVILFAACLAIGAEAVQPLVMRSASWRDAAYGMVGVGIAATLLARSLPKAICAILVLVLLAWPIWQTVPLMVDAANGWRSFPVLAEFRSAFATRRWLMRDARLTATGEQGILKTTGNGESGSGAILIPIVQDWGDYDRLEFSFSFTGEPLTFLVSVRTGGKFAHQQSHYDLGEQYSPGEHKIAIDLAKMKPVGNDIPLELDRVQALLLIAFDRQPREIKLSPIRLTKSE